jgi:hypothetical protein
MLAVNSPSSSLHKLLNLTTMQQWRSVMTENDQNPAATNPSKADTSYDYETAWKGLNKILFITQYVMDTQGVQDELQTIQQLCELAITCSGPPIPAWGKLSASDAVKLITPLAQQMAAAPLPTYQPIFEAGYGILEYCKNIASLSGA